MKKIYIDIIKNSILSIGIALVIFCIFGIYYDLKYQGNFTLHNYQFTKMVLGSIITGLGFGIPSIIYQKDTIPMPIRELIHFGIGLVVYMSIAYLVGWINTTSIKEGVINVLILISIILFIHFIFKQYYKKEAKKINEKIKLINK